MVKVYSCTLKELFETNKTQIENSGIRGQLTIPEYQRPYVWREKQINRLLDDLIEYKKEPDDKKDLYYLGTIIMHQTADRLNIIDGQQRITTMLLFNAIKSPDEQSQITYTAPSSIERIKKNFAYLKYIEEGSKFEYQGNVIRETLDLDKINVTLVVTATEDLAYTFFETQNTGGVRLSGSDIIKAHHLRAIPSRKIVNYQARKWESTESGKVEQIVQHLSKVRYWDNRHWRDFPFYRDDKGIKDVLIDEFTERTKKNGEDISYYYSAVKKEDGRQFQLHESQYKQLKQPLSDGNNSLDYINDYIQLHEMLFESDEKDHRIPDEFFEFRDALLHGNVFLRELFEIACIAYVSRFGFYRLFDASLWLYRAIYSKRVTTDRNVVEAGVFKFVKENQFIDNILEVFTVDELLIYLKKLRFQFNTKNTNPNQSKDRHLKALNSYFDTFKEIDHYAKHPSDFDKHFVEGITQKLKSHDK